MGKDFEARLDATVDATPEQVWDAIAKALSEALPDARYRTLPGQTHMVKADAVAPSVKEFLAAASTR
ncbi:hypothetical protein ACIA5D_19040 [Actinoplanes sp. NPDC051513]|uniref:hypothetical protein n=1 Tax=Actinoplanes sp. NPDC051513 TaxID=3363908 RepID=UPI0037B2B8BA